MFPLVLLVLGVSVPIQAAPCFTEDKACQLDSSNFLGSVENIAGISECKTICEDTSDCQFFTYYDDESVPTYYQKCYLFSGCTNVIDFPRAYTGLNGPCTCSLEVEPQDGKMIKELYAETEIDCKDACLQNTGCEIYTFVESTFDCKLLQDVSSYDKSTLPGFHTGPGRCTSDDGICTFSLLDHATHLMLVESNEALVVRSGMLDCKANISMLLVGRGGVAGSWTQAGGSGFVSNMFANIYASTVLNVYFDDYYDGGSVAVYANGDRFTGQLILKAEGGQAGQADKGGDGYSGGAFGYAMDGGTDGGDGQCDTNAPDTCGKGQGIDVRQFSSPHYALTPGREGASNGANVAGGGGGVLVNGDETPIMGVSWGMGEGYSNKTGWALVLLEIVI